MKKTKRDDSYTGVRVLELSHTFINQLYAQGHIEIPDKRFVWYPNQYVYLKSNDTSDRVGAIARVSTNRQKLLLIRDKEIHASKIRPKNKEQVMALCGLLDDDIKLCTLTGRAGTGKAGSLDSIVYTPDGPVRMGDIQPGQLVCTPDGNTTRVLSVHPQGLKDIYRVVFTDGSSTETCDEHLWLTQTGEERDCNKPGRVRELREIRETLKYGGYRRNHSIPITQPVYFTPKENPIDAYLLGCLIGSSSELSRYLVLSNIDSTVLEEVSKLVKQAGDSLVRAPPNTNYDYKIDGSNIRSNITKLKLGIALDKRFIPDTYKYTGPSERHALLQGLMDAGGTVLGSRLSYTSVSEQLAKDVRWLVQSLGGIATITDRISPYNDERRIGQKVYIVHINLPGSIPPFRSKVKAAKYQDNAKHFPRRYIDRVEYVGKKEAQCIYIDHPDHLYLTDEFIVTHNTLLTVAAALQKMDERKYERIIITRPMSQVGRYDLGALPGDIDDKFGPYLENYISNIQQLGGSNRGTARDIIAMYKIEAVPMQLIRGASWVNTFIIADEMQVCDKHEILTLGTRVGEGSKLVIMGDLGQRDENIAREETGLYHIINSKKMKESPLTSHIQLLKSERSALSELFANTFEEIDAY